MALLKHNLKWRGTILGAFNVPTIVFKVVWRSILEEAFVIHGVLYFWISPSPKHMGELINSTPRSKTW
jgi:hypothetical protein